MSHETVELVNMICRAVQALATCAIAVGMWYRASWDPQKAEKQKEG